MSNLKSDFNLSEKEKIVWTDGSNIHNLGLPYKDLEGFKVFNPKDVKEFIRLLKEKDGAEQINGNLHKSFFGTFETALKNGYTMDKNYVIVDYIFFHDLLKKLEIDKLAGEKLIT